MASIRPEQQEAGGVTLMTMDTGAHGGSDEGAVASSTSAEARPRLKHAKAKAVREIMFRRTRSVEDE